MSSQASPIPLLSVQDIVHSYGSQPVLEDASLTVHAGDRIGLIGRNGSGKSTLMRLMAGMGTPDRGLVTRRQGVRVALLTQDCRLPLGETVAATLKNATAELRAEIERYRVVMERLAHTPGDCWEHRTLQDECDELQHFLDATGAWDLDQDVKRVSVALALPPPERMLDTLSGGELRRVDLAVQLIRHPDVLMLDEPTNHIDTRSVEWIERFLERYQGSCMLVTHDRYFLDRVVNRIVELEFNRLYSFPGSYKRFLLYKATVEQCESRTEANRLSFLRREVAWLRRGPKARATKQKARIGRALDAMEEGPPERHREFLFEIPESQRLSKTILEARQITHGYDEAPLFENFSLIMQKHMRVGIVGPNGSGKTTLLRVLMGAEEPRRGRVILGEATEFLYVDQSHEEIKPHESILDFVSGGSRHLEVNRRRIYVPAYLEKFLFDKDSVLMPVGNLSGGERNRLDLVKKLLRGGNFLVLDEPTNDLDLYSLRVLEETIDAFEGCALIVSHDRYFLNRICTDMLAFEEGGEVVHIVGNYEDYQRYREEKAAEKSSASRPNASDNASSRLATKLRKLTWKEKNELEKIEESILEAEDALSQAEHEVQEHDFYGRTHTEVQAGLAGLEASKQRVAELYTRWEELDAIQQGGAGSEG